MKMATIKKRAQAKRAKLLVEFEKRKARSNLTITEFARENGVTYARMWVQLSKAVAERTKG